MRQPYRVTVFLLIVAAQFGVFEAALRVWGSSEAAPSFQGLFMPDPDTGHRLKPGARIRFQTAEFDSQIAINNVGVRDDEDLGPKAPDERRIVILGDSLVLSVQVPQRQTFSELLESRLNSNQARYRYRVINAGVQGYGPVQQWLFFKSLAARLDPDIVVATVFVGNDAEEAFAARRALDRSRRPLAETASEAVATPLRRMVRRSMVLQVLRLRVVAATERFAPNLAPPEPPLQSYAARPAPRIQQGIDITRDCVRLIAKHAEALGARAAVLLMPARFQVDDGDYDRLRSAVAQAGGELLRDGATERFDRSFAKLPLPRLDLLPALRRALPGPDLFFQRNVHLTPRGHEVVAEALASFLARSGLIDDAAAPRREAR